MTKTKRRRQTGGNFFDDLSSGVTNVASDLKSRALAVGQAGTKADGQAGTEAVGQAGTKADGQAGTEADGQAGTEADGQAGTEAVGQAATKPEEKKWYTLWGGSRRRRSRCTKKHRHSSACKRKSKGRKSYRKRR